MAKPKRRRPRSILRITARVDVLGLLDRCAGYARNAWRALSVRAGSGSEVAWDDVPTHALVMTRDEPLPGRACVDRFLLRTSPDRGVVVGAIDRGKCERALVDDDLAHLESESWSGLRLRRGSARVVVLARRVSRDATADEMLELIRRGLSRLVRSTS
jgi:hypothetical protein